MSGINNIKKSISGIVYFFLSSIFFVFILREFGMFKATKNSILGLNYELIFRDNIVWKIEIMVILTILAILTLIFTFLNDQFFRHNRNFSLKEIGFFPNIKTKPVILVFFLSVILISIIFHDFSIDKSMIIKKLSLLNLLFIFYISIVISIFHVLLMKPFKSLLNLINKKFFAYIVYDVIIVLTQMISFALFDMHIDLLEVISAILWGFIYIYTYDTSDYSVYPLWALIFVRYVSIFL